MDRKILFIFLIFVSLPIFSIATRQNYVTCASSGYVTCNICNGIGRVRVVERARDRHTKRSEFKRCSVCNGTGRKMCSWRKCRGCTRSCWEARRSNGNASWQREKKIKWFCTKLKCKEDLFYGQKIFYVFEFDIRRFEGCQKGRNA